MAIKVDCSECFHSFSVKDEFAGKKGKCPECGCAIQVPSRGSSPAGRSATAPSTRRSSRSGRSKPRKGSKWGLILGLSAAGLVIAVGGAMWILNRPGGEPAPVAGHPDQPASVPTAVTTPATVETAKDAPVTTSGTIPGDLAPVTQLPKGPVDFYGKQISFIKMFGQPRRGEYSPGYVDGTRGFQVAGVVVDRTLTPNAIYVADNGNNRILGFRSYNSKKADLIFGQPDEFSGAPNGDCNTGLFGKPSRTSLCLMNIPGNTNVAEQWSRNNFDVDAEGNLYFLDHGNNRILIFYTPFSENKSGGKGDTIPDFIIGQPDYTSNDANRGKEAPAADSLYTAYLDGIGATGVSVDPQQNVWVADTFNSRVLRFPKGQTVADLVLGQPDFTSGFRKRTQTQLDRLTRPVLARVHPETGEVYVIDSYDGFQCRLLVFKPPFRNGMAANRTLIPKQRLEGDYANGYSFHHVTGLVFNPIKTDDWIDEQTKTHRYRDGAFWLHDAGEQHSGRTLLLDAEGNILLSIGAPDLITSGGRYDKFHAEGPETPFNLVGPGGMIGFDSANNIYLADMHWHRVARFALPYRLRSTPKGKTMPLANGGLFPTTRGNSVGPADITAGMMHVAGNQLIVNEGMRMMVWNDYLKKPDAAPADLFIGQKDGFSSEPTPEIAVSSSHRIEDPSRLLWLPGPHRKVRVYQLPLTAESQPLRSQIEFFWADQPDQKVEYQNRGQPTFDARNRRLWIMDFTRSRLLGVKVPEKMDDKFLVDAVIGQTNKTEIKRNRGMAKPDAASLGNITQTRFDRSGNLFVVDNAYEGHPNGRIITFMAEDLAGIKTLFPKLEAKKVFVVNNFNETNIIRIHEPYDFPFSPVSVAFNSRNEMVVGNDGYYRDARKRNITQLYLYRKPFQKPTPDAVIELPLGAPGELEFDDQDNLIVLDHTFPKVWIINYDRDPAWLRPL